MVLRYGVLLGLLLAWPLWGFDRTQIPGHAATPAPRLTAEQAAERVRQHLGGRVLSVHPRPGGYEVRLLTARGQVRVLWIPSRAH